MTTTTMMLATTTKPEITAFAADHISARVLVFSFSLKIGMNDAVNAPSPRRRRKRLGIWNASAKAPATIPTPMNHE